MSTDDPFAELPREVAPPAALKHRTLRALRGRGLLRPRVGVLSLGRVAAAVLLFAVGAYAGRVTHPSPTSGAPVPDTRDQFALLLYEPASFDTTLAHEQLAVEYRAWAGSLGGDFVSGEALGDARVLGGDAPTAEPTGFFMIRADSYDEAVALARDCPHLRHGGVVSVRTVPAT